MRRALAELDRLAETTLSVTPNPHTRPAPSPLRDAIRILMKAANWTQADLARATGVNKTLVTRWLAYEPGAAAASPISRTHLARIAWAISGKLDDLNFQPAKSASRSSEENLYEARDALPFILSVLFSLSGHRVFPTLRDLVWQRHFAGHTGLTQSTRLQIGIFDWAPAKQCGFTDFAKEVSLLVCRTLGQPEVEFVERATLSELTNGLRERTLDLIAPFLMEYPARLTWHRFSDRLDGIRMHIEGLVLSDSFEQLRAARSSESLSGLDAEHCRVRVSPDEIASSVAAILFPKEAIVELDADSDPYARLEMLANGIAPSAVTEIVLTNNVTCAFAEVNFPGRFCRLSDLLEERRGGDLLKPQKLGVAFALHPDEPRLLRAVNQALKLMQDRSPYRSALNALQKNDKGRWFYEAKKQ